MDVDQFIWSTGVKMDRPIHLGKDVAWWADGILDNCEYDKWFAVLEVNGKEIGVFMHSSIEECTEGYIPSLADFLGKIQDVAFADHGCADDESPDEILLWEATDAFTREQFCDLMGVDFTARWKEAYSGV